MENRERHVGEIFERKEYNNRKAVWTSDLLCFYSRVTGVIQVRDGWSDYFYLDLKKAFHNVSHK